MANELLLKVNDLTVIFDGVKVLDDVSFEIKKEEVLAVIGPNGSGKSVLLKTLIGITKQTSGTIEWAPEIRIGYLPQRFQVDKYLPMTVKEFLELKPDPKESINTVLKEINLDKTILNEAMAHLSGGQLQKILLVWAIIDKPHILLFDEPTENIDVVGQESVYKLLHHLQDLHNIALIIVSHDLHVVYRYANHVLCLNQKMLCYGEPHKTLTNEHLAELYGDHAFFHHHHYDV
ncbi:MAG: metal ABC transporter ATP-binding protein [Patescibacteria group bacterium]|nr:metal ABC transporter ATP-binding protein [Patescibacteria group bacterium]